MAWTTDPKDAVSTSDLAYVQQLARDTWACIDWFRNDKTGLPYDSNFFPDTTNTTNVALYLVSTVAADRLGLITSDEAKSRINKILTTLDQSGNFRGFFVNHLNVNGITKNTAGTNAVSDFNKLPAALLIIRQAFPDIKLATKLFNQVDWSWLWDQSEGQFHQGFDVSNGKTYFWGNGWLASDVRLAAFLGVATGGMPVQVYRQMERNQATQYGLVFYRPAWEFAGLFMHAMGGLFLNERETPMGLSAANFAYAQMLFAGEKGYPVWGWSACHRPGDGYTVNGLLSQAVVTPHASALMISYYPRKVIANLRALQALGCRKPYVKDRQSHAFGFWDSINLTTKEVSDHYYTSLDQAMLFIALADFLKPGCIHRLFMRDPVVKKGLRLIGKEEPVGGHLLELYAQRDRSPLPPPRPVPAGKMLEIDNFKQNHLNQLGRERALELEQAPKGAAKEQRRFEAGRGKVWQVTYDLTGREKANLVLKENLNHLDARGYNAVAFGCSAVTSDGHPLELRLRFTDGYGSREVGFISGLNAGWQEVVFPFELLRGILVEPSDLKTMEIGLERAPAEFTDRPLTALKGVLSVANIKLVKLDKDTYQKAVQAVEDARRLSWKKNGDVAGLARLPGWQTYKDADAFVALAPFQEGPAPALKLDYHLTPTGHWVAGEKAFAVELPDDFAVTFEVRGGGDQAALEFKLTTPSGAVFGKTLPNYTALPKWTKVTLEKAELNYLWGGDRNDGVKQVRTLGLAVSGQGECKGWVGIRGLKIIRQ